MATVTKHATFQHVITMVVTAHLVSVMRDAQITGSEITTVIQHATLQHVKTMLEIAESHQVAKVQAVSHQVKKVQAGQETKVQAVQDPVLRDA